MAYKKLILVELNEINFDLVRKYLHIFPDQFPGFERLVNGYGIQTTSEDSYDELEPWIQWVSVHTGKTFKEHNIFRLGDIAGSDHIQIFEDLESRGYSVGCISPMNAVNRLRNPSYFIPDPWTNTSPDRSWLSGILSSALSQAVKDNSRNYLSFKNTLVLLINLIRFARLKHYIIYFKLAIKSIGSPWRKALFLDLFLHDLHFALLRIKPANFSTLLLNAGAHIQHHYLFNSLPVQRLSPIQNPGWYISKNIDPFMEMLEVYDLIIRDFFTLSEFDSIIATGLSQVPYDKNKFYYRLKAPESFLSLFGIKFASVSQLMTRDFVIYFSSECDSVAAENILRKIYSENDGSPIFGDINNRGLSIFLTLSYSCEITSTTFITFDSEKFALKPHVVFVAIKNGMHHSKGYAFFTPGASKFAPKDGSHVKNLYYSILNFFIDEPKG